MVFVEKFFVLLIAFTLGVLIVRYCEPIVRTIGHSAWAEQHLGAGGSYMMWKIIGILIPVLTLIFVTRYW